MCYINSEAHALEILGKSRRNVFLYYIYGSYVVNSNLQLHDSVLPVAK